MFCVSVSSSWSLLILLLFVNSQQTFAKPAKRLAGATTVPKKIQQCNNVYFNEAPNEKIATILKEIKEQLGQIQTDINEKIGNKTNEKGMNSLRSLCVSRPTYQMQFSHRNIFRVITIIIRAF